MTPRVLTAFGLFALSLALALEPAPVHGCGGAYHIGERVDVADETALIIWDERTKTQHFIRRATFVGSAYDFGFLVPTPSKPELAVANPDLFEELGKITQPKTELRTQSGSGCSGGCGGGTPGIATRDEARPTGVVVLEQKVVGGLDAAVLGFKDDAGQKPEDSALELLAWLTRNQYAVRPELLEWIVPYARDKWVITAFKIASESRGQAGKPETNANGHQEPMPAKAIALQAAAVRMSFKTERPFFPYREPADQRDVRSTEVKRLLRVFVAANQRMAGKLGDGLAGWPGKTVWANAVTEAERDSVLGKALIRAATPPQSWFLTEFEDRSSPRPGTDEVYFEPSLDRSVVSRTPKILVMRSPPSASGYACSCLGWIGVLTAGPYLLRAFVRWLRRLDNAAAKP